MGYNYEDLTNQNLYQAGVAAKGQGSGGGVDWLKLLSPGVGSLLGGIGGLLSGKSDEEKRREELYGRLQGMLGKNVQPNTGAYLGRVQASLAPYLNKIAGGASARVGLDSGAAQGEIARANYGALQGAGADYQRDMEQFNQNRQMQLLQLMAMLGRG